MNDGIARVLRAFAIVLALVCAIDPAVTSTRRSRPVVAVVAGDSSSRSLATQVAKQLSSNYSVVPAPFAAASATVLVGDQLPSSTANIASPVFAVLLTHEGPTPSIEGVQAPLQTPFQARASIVATTHVTEAKGRMLNVSLLVGGVVVDQVRRPVATDDDRQRVPLTFVPTVTGAVPLRVTAQVDTSTANADVLIDVREQRWAVFFYDPRPSWMSTFVRRALERDPRFAVTSRVVTSRNISTDAGKPPTSLDDLAALELYDVVIIGAPESLSDREVTGLDTYLRRHGGGVVLLLDSRASGTYERLADVGSWAGTTSGVPMHVEAEGTDLGELHAGEIAWPTSLPPGAEPLATNLPPSGDTSKRRPVVWRSAVGAGRLVVSGALDSWRQRDSTSSVFDTFWQGLIAETADADPMPVGIRLARPLLTPGERGEVTVVLRGSALAALSADRSVHASVSATIESADHSTAIRLLPNGPIGELRGSFRAPTAPGLYDVSVLGNGVRADAPLAVATEVVRPAQDQRDLVKSFASSRGGAAVPASRLHELPAMIARTVQTKPHVETWHPMRSAWWLIPFALALSTEWWWRRRRGFA